MIVEMHCHTSEHSRCSHVAAVELLRRADQMGIETIVLTDHHDVQRHAPAEIFLETYLVHADNLEEDFMPHVDLYKARACLSILYYLTKVDMAESENFWRILVEAEKSLASIEVLQTP